MEKTSEVLKKVRRIEIRAGRLVNEAFAGRFASTFKGRGMEFSEVREYLPGDDVRGIDWNVSARMGHPYIKKFIEERELTVIFLVDLSASQGFASRGRLKAELAAEITAVLSFSALRNNDKVGMMLFSDDVERHFPPKKSKRHILRLIRELISFRPKGRGTSLSRSLSLLNRVQRRRAVVFLISDFLDAGYEKALRVARRRHDLIALPLSDPWEAGLPPDLRLTLEDAEEGRVAEVRTGNASPPLGRAEALKTLLRRNAVDSVFVETGASYVKAFLAFFQERARRFR